MKNVTLIATGGTIASISDREGGPVNAGLAGERLIDSLHERPAGGRVHVEDFEALGSYALDLETVHRLCTRIDEVLADDAVDGVVVTHGTDTMEESAFLADLLVTSDKPVVFTGAQRHAGAADTDGPRNIADAIVCAGCDGLWGQGAVILFEGDIHAARDVTKAHTSRVDTFRSVGLGKLGEVDAGAVYLYRRTMARKTIPAPRMEPGVELLLLGLGSTPDYLDYCESAGKSGIVLAAFGRGNAPRGFAERIARLTERGIPVVVASRCAEGRTLPVYGKDSGGRTLEEAGVIFAGSLSPIKSRLLLSVLLGAGEKGHAIRAGFADADRSF